MELSVAALSISEYDRRQCYSVRENAQIYTEFFYQDDTEESTQSMEARCAAMRNRSPCASGSSHRRESNPYAPNKTCIGVLHLCNF